MYTRYSVISGRLRSTKFIETRWDNGIYIIPPLKLINLRGIPYFIYTIVQFKNVFMFFR